MLNIRKLFALLAIIAGLGLFGHVAVAATEIKAAQLQQVANEAAQLGAATDANSRSVADLPNLVPGREHSITARHLATLVDSQHYLGRRIDEKVSAETLVMLIDSLDPEHALFLQADIVGFQKAYGKSFATDLQRGDLTAAYKIYNQYLRLIHQNLSYLLTRLDKPLSLESNDVLQQDREKAAYFSNVSEQKKYWDAALRSQLITMTIDNNNSKLKQARNPEQLKEVIAGVHSDNELSPIETLKKRYTRQLQRLYRVKSDQVTEQTLNALLAVYDPHSSYAAPVEAMEMNRQTSLQLIGVGVSIRPVKGNEDYIRVESLVEGGPSARSGLVQAGDIILGVQQDGEPMVDVVGWPSYEVVGLIRGERKTKVTLRLLATGAALSQARNVTIVRDVIEDKEAGVQQRVIEKTHQGKTYRIGVLDIPSFYLNHRARREGSSYRSVSNDTLEAIQKLREQNIDGMVIDLQGNPGGSLDEVVRMVGMFVPEGPAVQIRDQDGNTEVLKDYDNGKLAYAGPLVVLIDLASASASEIFAAAMQDYQRGVVLGSATLGKGTAQVQIEQLAHGQANLTNKKFYRITGGSTQNKGVEPDIAAVNVYGDAFGERKLKNPLVWDTIKTALFKPYQDLRSVLPTLNERSQARQKQHTQYAYLSALTAEREKNDKKEPLTLSLKKRKAQALELQNTLLQIENKRRQAMGLAVYSDWVAMDLSKEAESEQRAKQKESERSKLPESEFFIDEGANVVLDIIALQP